MRISPGRLRSSSFVPESGCSCLVVGIVIALILAAIMLGFAMHAVDVMDAGWQS